MIAIGRSSLVKSMGIVAAAVLTMMLWTSESQAQAKNYQFFRTDSGLIGAYVPGTGAFGGGAMVEPKLNITDQLSIGARTSAAITGGGSLDGDNVSVGIGIAVDALLKGEYYFSTGSTRPFLGFGAGFYYLVSQSVDTGGGGASVSQGAGKYFGFAPQVGIQLGGFRIAVSYNAMLGADYEVTQAAGGPAKKVRQDYLSLDLAFRVKGGGKISID